jgi:hypothetical protein
MHEEQMHFYIQVEQNTVLLLEESVDTSDYDKHF